MSCLIKKSAICLALGACLVLIALSVGGHQSRLILLIAAGCVIGTWTITLRSLRRLSHASMAPTKSPGRQVALLGLLAGVAALLQCSPAFFPGFGHLLAAFSSLPIAIGTLAAPDGTLAMVGAATSLLVILQLDEAVIFALTTAPLGAMAACVVLTDVPWWRRSLLPGIALGSGILLMSYVIGLPSLGPMVHGLGPVWAPAIYLGFSYAYATIWVGMLLVIRRYLRAWNGW